MVAKNVSLTFKNTHPRKAGIIMVRVIFVLLATLYVGAAGDIGPQWETWKNDFGKTYATKAEESRRFNIWSQARKYVNNHNALLWIQETTFRIKLNRFADMTDAEVRSLLMPTTGGRPAQYGSKIFTGKDTPPLDVDWRKHGYVTAVKDQGPLASSYAFSALGALEGQHYKSSGRLVSLSEQQVIDCDSGVNGNSPSKVFNYGLRSGGFQRASVYPYKGKIEMCGFDSSKVAARLSNYKFVGKFGDEKALQRAVAKIGPISVSAIPIFRSFTLYDSGIYYEPKCALRMPLGYNAMVAVGYGTENGNDFWIVKNSWGPRWGEDGYIRMSRNRNNNCGIASEASYPIAGGRRYTGTAEQETTTTGSGIRIASTLIDFLITGLLSVIFL